MSIISRSIAGAVVEILASWTEDGVTHKTLSSGFLIGGNSVGVALHAAQVIGKNGIITPDLTVVMSDGRFIPVVSRQSYVDLAEWNRTILAQGGESPHEVSRDIAVLRISEAVGFKTGWFPLYDLDSGPVTVYGYPGGSYGVIAGGTLQDTSFRGDAYSSISGVTGIPGDSGGLVMDAAGNAVAVVSGGVPGVAVINAVDLSPELIAKVQHSIALNDTFIAPEIAGREAYYLAHQLSPAWTDVNLGELIAQQNWSAVTSTVENAIVAAVHEVGSEIVVSFIAQRFDVSLSPEEHQVASTVLDGTHQDQINLIGVLENAMLPLMGHIPMIL